MMATATAPELVDSIPTNVPASPTATMTAVDAACYLISSSWDRWQFAFSGATWADYQRLLDVRLAAGRKAVRITYSDGEVEIVTVGNIHEEWKSVLSLLLKIYWIEAKCRARCCGSMTISRQDLDRGFEPDECFYLANLDRVLVGRQLDFATDPPPDLAVEIEVSRSMIEKLPVYAAFRVPEIWRFDGTDLTVLLLGADGSYTPSKTSLAVPRLPLAELVRFTLLSATVDDITLATEFREFVRSLPAT